MKKGILIFFIIWTGFASIQGYVPEYPIISFAVSWFCLLLFLFAFMVGVSLITGFKWNDLLKEVFLKEK